ncbi:hypothetical protein FA15DRAFT_296203 [Coprinopsis marcescibilis]|uniref:Uncharacterized protein n=1 Tax=Coprinopsis marcescibilis TaxID=230819 RepID=A0A5C3KE45_COPMA|nr:hypothetical protein FA15DRAFT_296203 [Coprinopsis marcescibilis]
MYQRCVLDTSRRSQREAESAFGLLVWPSSSKDPNTHSHRNAKPMTTTGAVVTTAETRARMYVLAHPLEAALVLVPATQLSNHRVSARPQKGTVVAAAEAIATARACTPLTLSQLHSYSYSYPKPNSPTTLQCFAPLLSGRRRRRLTLISQPLPRIRYGRQGESQNKDKKGDTDMHDYSSPDDDDESEV